MFSLRTWLRKLSCRFNWDLLIVAPFVSFFSGGRFDLRQAHDRLASGVGPFLSQLEFAALGFGSLRIGEAPPEPQLRFAHCRPLRLPPFQSPTYRGEDSHSREKAERRALASRG